MTGEDRTSADSVTVALLDEVDPEHAPRPRNPSERILFRHLYQTLVRIDCLGEAHPDLAASWSNNEGGRVWSFQLNEGALFWDGSSVTAGDVAAGWNRAPDDMNAFFDHIDSTSVEGDRILHVHFRSPHKQIPRFLAASEFAVAKPAIDSKWPLGSGSYQVVTSKKESGGMFKRTITVYPHYNREGPVIRFVEASAYDARDLLEGAVDMMVTDDPAVIDYARTLPRLDTAALPWDRTYVLVSNSRYREMRRGVALEAIPPDLSEELARYAVRSEARGFLSPVWWEEMDDCNEPSGIPPGSARVLYNPDSNSGLRRVLYDTNDAVARDIAERIIALAMTDVNVSPAAAALVAAVPGLGDGTEGMIAQGLDKKELAGKLRSGEDFAYIIALPRRAADPCCEARMLVDRMPWMADLGKDFARVLVPLVDTRSHVIVKGEGVALSVDGFGNVVITNRTER